MSNKTPSPAAVDGRALPPLTALRAEAPAWASALAAAQPDRWLQTSVTIAGVEALDAAALEAAVADAYHRLAATLGALRRHPVRFWNFLPGIHADMGSGLDRYMAFNAGRFAAFCKWFGPAATFNRHVPTASAVGVTAGPLVVHALATTDAGSPVENPRQIPAYSYSRRYGPLPPCFARATLVRVAPDATARLMVGGTASIVGEDSQHIGDARRQTLETFDNLTRLVEHAGECAGFPERLTHPLHAFTALRVYLARPGDAGLVRDLVTACFASLTSVEFAQADLCRRELLVEIEGLAEMPVSASR